jgi:CRP/FNR family transcriptional regulator, cyclic AMP receptor protein
MKDPTPWYWDPFDLFKDAGPEASRAFFAAASKHDYARRDYIFMANDAGQRIFFLETGVVKIFDLSSSGGETIFWYCFPHDVFGAGGISGSLLQSVHAQAVEPSTVYVLSRSDFEDILKQFPQLAINVVRLMGARLRLACDSMVALAEQRTELRLARVLLRLAHNYGMRVEGHVALRMRVSNQELAGMIGSSRQTVNSLLHEFEANGWIRLEGRTLSIVSIGDLQEMLNSDSTEPAGRH